MHNDFPSECLSGNIDKILTLAVLLTLVLPCLIFCVKLHFKLHVELIKA